MRINFRVVERGDQISKDDHVTCYLRREGTWNDWFKYVTVFELIYIDEDGEQQSAGSVKIGETGMDTTRQRADEEGLSKTRMPAEFQALPATHFSLGQSENYYETIACLGEDVRECILTALRDIAYDPNLIDMYKDLDVYQDSITRDIGESVITGRYSRLARGMAALSQYSFSFIHNGDDSYSAYKMDFSVIPESMPPSNLHAIIGRNGVGKTHCLRSMVLCLLRPVAANSRFRNQGDDQRFPFRRVVSVSFSAFDPFAFNQDNQEKLTGIQHEYIGLKGISVNGTPDAHDISDDSIFESFVDAAIRCKKGVRRARWQKALCSLDSDPIFSKSSVVDIAFSEDHPAQSRELFNRLSSGHKIILLTITRLVAATEEGTLILLDEPEAHLHPPLLSAFIRCLSELLINRNGVAIIATHSPVVLQEIPSSCSFIMSRNGGSVYVDRPELETFGESVGILTAEVFGLEVVQSGFNSLIRKVASENSGYDEALRVLGGRLGSVGRSMLRMSYVTNNEDS